MRKITVPQILVFSGYFTTAVVLGIGVAWWLFDNPGLGGFRSLAIVLGAVALTYLFTMLAYRVFLRVTPLVEGECAPGSKGEFAAQVNTLFYLIVFNSLIKTHVLPIPLMAMLYRVLGATIGADSYGGILLEPPLTTIGRRCILGHDALLFAHVIGDDVTVGAHAIVMPGVRIGHGAIVSAGAVVSKNTRIPAGETWGGVPARRLRSAPPSSLPQG